MKTIKILKKNDWKLEHYRFRDDVGLLIDSCHIVCTFVDGSGVNFPVKLPMKARASNKDILDATSDYTDEEYNEFLDSSIKRLATYVKTKNKKWIK